MAKSSRYRQSAAGELPRTLQRSSPEAQAAFLEARKFEKRGDQWIAKSGPPA